VTEPMVTVRGLTRTYGSGSLAVHALDDVSFDVAPGELVAIVGRSGSGKTTLLNLIGGLDHPDSGTVRVDGTEVTGLDDEGLSRLRRDSVSYVFQTFGLIPALTAAENVGVPLRLRRTPAADRDRRVALLLTAGALAGSPRLLVADEPTGQLDAETGLSVMALLRGLVESEGVTVIVSTHDPVLMALADRVLTIADGRLG
jgi:putative ABC transport system ATP-binding protein